MPLLCIIVIQCFTLISGCVPDRLTDERSRVIWRSHDVTQLSKQSLFDTDVRAMCAGACVVAVLPDDVSMLSQ
jgi:hypothetical protein